MRVGFIGLGIMGRHMARNLIEAGHTLTINRVKEISRFLIDAGAIAADSAREVAASSDVIILMVSDTPDVEQVLFGPNGVVEGVSPGKLIIDMSSISPVATRDFAARIAELGCSYVDAPVSGGEVGAKNATLTIMAGGSQAAFGQALPLLECMGKSITLVGGVGAGQTAKVANQIIVGLTISAVAEGLMFTERAGADPEKVRQALMGGFASSRILEVHGERMTSESFDPGFRIRLHRKDLALAIDAARQIDIALPGTALAQQLMNAAIARGDGDLDHSGLFRTLKALNTL